MFYRFSNPPVGTAEGCPDSGLGESFGQRARNARAAHSLANRHILRQATRLSGVSPCVLCHSLSVFYRPWVVSMRADKLQTRLPLFAPVRWLTALRTQCARI